ncbi:MAG: MerR family transcriptional regulator [Candidatus Wallbacteria bacterium]|nr:MerR family transcriptional regulator [Candidatus Wallbacteria bacterium]
MTGTVETFSLQDVARVTGIKETTLRFYLKRFREFFEPMKRGPFNSIIFEEKDINLLLKIRTLCKQHSMPMGEIEATLRSENLPAISIIKDENSPAVAREAVDGVMRMQNDLKKILCDNAIALSEIVTGQQLMQEKQMRMAKVLQQIEKMPEYFESLQEKIRKQEEAIGHLADLNGGLAAKIRELETSSNKLVNELHNTGDGFWARIGRCFKTWFFEENI